VTAATPNEPEVEEALGVKIGDDSHVSYWPQATDEAHEARSLVITRGRDGMVAFDKNAKPLVIGSSVFDQVVDVTGAGDTVIATFTAALAAARYRHRRTAGEPWPAGL